MVCFIVSALGALWVLAGLLAVHIAVTLPPDPDDPPTHTLDVAQWVMVAWAAIVLVAIGPFGLSVAIEKREERWGKVLAHRNRRSGNHGV